MKITVKHLLMMCLSFLALACGPKEPVKYIALSFDDGPNLTTESKMLDVLAKHKVPATFFVIGNNITKESEKNMKRAVKQGCEIGNHSLTHPMMSTMTEEQVKAEIEATSGKIKKVIGKEPEFFRPPYINVKPEMYDWIDLTFICGKGSSTMPSPAPSTSCTTLKGMRPRSRRSTRPSRC